MIEEVGKDAVASITNLSEEQVSKGPDSTYPLLISEMKTSLKDEVDKSDIWFPIVQRFLEAHGSKAPFNMNDRQREEVKNASPDRINESRNMIKNSIDEFMVEQRGPPSAPPT